MKVKFHMALITEVLCGGISSEKTLVAPPAAIEMS